MGVYRITALCRNDQEFPFKVVQANKGSVIIIDGSSFLFYVVSISCRDAAPTLNYAHFLGGEHAFVDDLVRRLVTFYSSRGVKLHVLFDPTLGGESAEDFDRKLPLWVDRYEATYASIKTFEDFCDRKAGFENQMVLHRLAHVQVMRSFRKYGAEVGIARREADVELVSVMRQEDALCVVSSDSDFAVIPHSRWLSMEDLFAPALVPGITESAAAAAAAAVPSGEVHLRLVTPKRVAQKLEIPKHWLLHIAALCGNDATKPILDKVPSRGPLCNECVVIVTGPLLLLSSSACYFLCGHPVAVCILSLTHVFVA